MQPRAPRGYLSTTDVTKAINDPKWPTYRVRRWLQRDGALVRKGRHYYTTRSKLQKAFGEIYDELFLQNI